jgi:hypothetical protein
MKTLDAHGSNLQAHEIYRRVILLQLVFVATFVDQRFARWWR